MVTVTVPATADEVGIVAGMMRAEAITAPAARAFLIMVMADHSTSNRCRIGRALGDARAGGAPCRVEEDADTMRNLPSR
ncbi:hypothetical protein GCM10018952_51250 [Streptosporangium vulgare]